jgi:hypothetical protein
MFTFSEMREKNQPELCPVVDFTRTDAIVTNLTTERGGAIQSREGSPRKPMPEPSAPEEFLFCNKTRRASCATLVAANDL